MSRLLLKKNDTIEESTSEELIKDAKLDWNENTLVVQWQTPKKARDIYMQADIAIRLDNFDFPIQRQLFWKIIKWFDKKDYVLVDANLWIEQLEAKLEEL